ncbi:MAG: ribosomal protein S12 methylthiotransferase RimO [Candidatus Melainabacteria bacterium GWF2_32_7]|nr:MAG: ribosomal protein S12 methylthiotransferase RimO [Candidatus Melainabacteria bacterium GWF2_32_7]
MKNKPTIGLINFGCPKNLVDSENMLGILSKNGYKINLDEEKADIILVNTCAFIKDAEKESVKAIVELAQSGKKIIITGCLAQKYKKELMELIPEALAFVGTGDIEKISGVVEKISHNTGETLYEISENPYYSLNNDMERFQITVGSSSYIKIAEGCDYSCAYCVIPALRGKYRSRTIESIVKEAKSMGQKGVSEVILIAQDTTNYGKDLYGKPSLPELLRELNKIEEISWIRVMYAYPSLVNDDFIEAIATLDKVVKSVDIPLQHSHPEMLKLMNRPAIDNGKIIEKLRKNIPGVSIRTVFITGFPGETEEHFEHLYNFIEKYKFDKLGVFEYSKEKHTDSYKLKGHVSAKIKKLRKKRLMELQQKISKKINASLIGKEIISLIEVLTSDGKIIGRTYKDAPEIDGLVFIETKKTVSPGDVVQVKITGASEYDLYGVV